MSLLNDSPLWLVDCDGTLVEHGPGSEAFQTIKCPYLGDDIYVAVNYNNVRLVKEKFVQGKFILVWSQGGAMWAQAVVKALELENYVNMCSGKPEGLIDDLPAADWMPANTNLPTDLKWKA